MGKGHMKNAMELAGSQHRYQTVVVGLLCVSWIVVNLMFLSSTYVFMQPVFQCEKNPTYKFHQVQVCKNSVNCNIKDDFSLTAHMGLYCEMASSRVWIQSIFPIGSFIGLFIINLLSDTRGRKYAFQLTLTICLIGIVCNLSRYKKVILKGGEGGSVPCLLLGQFLLGFGSYPIFPLGYTLLYDFLSDSYRPIAVVIINSAGGFATFLLGIIYLIQINWFNFLVIFILIPLIILLLFVCIFLQQSPYILMNRNQQTQALLVLEIIAKFNQQEHNLQDIHRIIEAQSIRDSQSQANLENVYKKVKQWKYLKSIILLTLIYGITNLNFYGISYSYEQQGFGFGYNSLIAGCVQMGSFIFLKWTVKKIPRKVGIAFFYTLVMIVGLSFLSSHIKQSVFLSTLLLGISKLSSTNAYCLIACMETESFSVNIQSTATGMIEAFALYGALIAPLIVNVALRLGIDPIAMVAFFVNFGIWPTYFLRETFQKANREVRGPLFKHLKDYQEMSDLTDVTSISSG